MWKLLMAVLWFVLQANLVLPVSGLPTSPSVGSKQNPGKSCNDIKSRGGTATNNYYIRLNGRTVEVHCDQTTAGGGWTLVYSFAYAKTKQKAITPRPNWPIYGETPISTAIPMSESDFNAMDFNLWRELGMEFMIKTNLNNWIVCTDRTGSLVYWRSGSLECKIVNIISPMSEKCPNIVPNAIMTDFYFAGPNIYDDRVDSGTEVNAYYFLDTWITGVEEPYMNPCGKYRKAAKKDLQGNIYIR